MPQLVPARDRIVRVVTLRHGATTPTVGTGMPGIRPGVPVVRDRAVDAREKTTKAADMLRQTDRRDAGCRGLTLLELLAVVALLSLLLVALADRGVASVDLGGLVTDAAAAGTRDDGSEAALRRLGSVVRAAVDVRAAGPERLELVDAAGGVTRLSARDGALRLARDGSEEVLVGGVTDASFEVRTRRELVDAAPEERSGTLWTSDPGSGATRPTVLEAGRQLALGFTLPVAAPTGTGSVPEVPEELVEAVPERLVLRMGRVAGHHEVFCHRHARPPHLGAHPAGRSSVTVSLHAARAPGDARPTGDALATLAVPASSLPEVEHNWYDTRSDDVVLPPEILEPGTGIAWSWWERHPEVVLNLTPSLREVELDLRGFGAVIRPGRAYTLVVGVSGVDLLVVEVDDDAPSRAAPVAVREATGRPMTAASFGVWSRIDGRRTYSRALEVSRPREVVASLGWPGGRRQDLVIGMPTRVVEASVAAGPVPVPDVDALRDRLREATAGSGVRVTRLSGNTLLEDAELRGIVAIEDGAVVYLDDVVVDGVLVSASLLDGRDGGVPARVVVDGDVRVGSEHLLPGLAIALPGGSIRTSDGCRPAFQVVGDVVADEVELAGHGTLHGRVAAATSRLDDGITQPVFARARRLRAPGLGR